jgi:hypothetical protein
MTHRPPVVPSATRIFAGPARLLGLGAIVASLGLAACGGSGGSGAKASAATPADNALKFSKCMREHGVASFPDPEISGGNVKLQFKATGGQVSPQTLEAAQRACQRYQAPEQQNLTPQQKVEREEAGLKFAKCMREHGINLPNPTTSGGGIRIKGGPGTGLDPSSPAFEAAQKACQGLLPKFKGGGGPRTGTVKGGGGAGLSLSPGG